MTHLLLYENVNYSFIIYEQSDNIYTWGTLEEALNQSYYVASPTYLTIEETIKDALIIPYVLLNAKLSVEDFIISKYTDVKELIDNRPELFL